MKTDTGLTDTVRQTETFEEAHQMSHKLTDTVYASIRFCSLHAVRGAVSWQTWMNVM